MLLFRVFTSLSVFAFAGLWVFTVLIHDAFAAAGVAVALGWFGARPTASADGEEEGMP